MAQAAAALGVSIDVIRLAKKSGCDAIRGNGSVDSKKLLAWISEHDREISDQADTESLRDQKTREEIRKLKHHNDERDRLYVGRAEVKKIEARCISRACEILDNRLVNEGPPQMVDDKDVPRVRAQLRRHVDAAKKEIQKIGDLLDTL